MLIQYVSELILFSQIGSNEELRCVLAIIRHGDRTPKQKIKVKVCKPYSFLRANIII